MDASTKEVINKYNDFNGQIAKKCCETDELLKRITLAYKMRIDADTPFVVSFVGRFKTGKSSLINALLGYELLPTRATTATSVVTRIFYGEMPKCYFRDENGVRETSFQEGSDIILNYKVTDPSKAAEVIFELPISWLSNNIEIRDTPGMDDSSQDGKLEVIALNALKDTDMCVCVFDACTMISEKERSRTHRIHKMMSGNVVFAVNCTNRLNTLEDLRQVDRIANNFFGAMEYSIPGMGKHYMMCSAPKMIALEGFDAWLKDFLSKSNTATLELVRTATGRGQISVIEEDFNKEIRNLKEQLTNQIADLEEKHTELKTENQRLRKKAAQDEADTFEKMVAGLADDLVSAYSELKPIIQTCKDKGTDYEESTKAETKKFFIKRYNAIKNNYGKHFAKCDGEFISATIDTITFPSTHVKAVAATSGEKVGWTTAGAVIGSLFAPGLGTLIGGALGRVVGGAETHADDSVDNTMSFIKLTVLPELKRAVAEKISTIKRIITENGCCECESGVEGIISQSLKIRELLNSYCGDD